jgi:hypothetical protein
VGRLRAALACCGFESLDAFSNGFKGNNKQLIVRMSRIYFYKLTVDGRAAPALEQGFCH